MRYAIALPGSLSTADGWKPIDPSTAPAAWQAGLTATQEGGQPDAQLYGNDRPANA